MVYCGRPSKGCKRCRIKRLKCSQQRPSCFQCQTAKVDCVGYRNEIDLLFRDESLSVARKFGNSRGQKSRFNERVVARLGSSDTCVEADVQALRRDEYISDDSMISYALSTLAPQPPIEKAATAFFLTSYLERSNFDYIPDMFDKTSTESLLSHAVEAVALAAFSNEVSQPSILELARKSYARSMHMARGIIDSPSLITADETLASILLLSRFDTLTHDCELDSICGSWSKHILGSLSIVQLRDQQQNFASETARKMYIQVMTNLHMYRISFHFHGPNFTANLKQRALEGLTPLDYWNLFESRYRFQVTNDELFEIRQALLTSPITEYRTVLKRAVALERKANQALSVMAGAGWRYEVVGAPSSPQSSSDNLVLYSDVYHVYKDAHEAQLWNSARMRSLGLNDALIEYAQKLIVMRDQGALPDYDPAVDEDLERIVATCQDTLDRMVDDICNSAPQFLRSGHSDCTVSACCYLVWPLFLATRCSRDRCRDLSVDRCKGFVIERLTWMADCMKIPIARVAVECLRVDDQPGKSWSYPYRDDFMIPFYTF